MRVLLVTSGSRGDVQPFVALARGLQDAGHDPVVAAPRRFAFLGTAAGVRLVGLDDSVFELQDEVAGVGVTTALAAAGRARPYLRRWLDDLVQLVALRPDLVVFTQKALGAAAVAEKCGVPAVPAQLIPLAPPTSAFAIPLAPVWTPRVLNRSSWRLAAAVEAPWRGLVATWRAERLGLPRRGAGFRELVDRHGILSGWSPHLLPAPPDWPTAAAPTGFWTLPQPTSQLPDDLERFLAAGDPPVLVGFGSMPSRAPATLTEEVVAGLRAAGHRGLLVGGTAGLGAGLAATDLYVIDRVPHQAVLPRVVLTVHHGGIGTVAAALAAGIPQVVHPFFGDQPFWAERLQVLGVAPDPLEVLTANRLTHALEAAARLRAEAGRLASRIAGEDGIANAVSRLEQLRTRN